MVAESRLSELPVEKAKKSVQNGPTEDSEKSNPKGKSSSGKGKEVETYEILEKFSGASLVGKKCVISFLFHVSVLPAFLVQLNDC